MAQSGHTPIQLYYSTTGAAQPLAADLQLGELALNVADGKLYYKNIANTVQLLVSAGTGGGTVTNVNGSGGTTGLTLTGGPITNTGTLTLGGTLAVANGGTGNTSYTDGQLLIGNTSTGGLTKATLTAGANVTITNAGGSITIASTGGTGGGVTSVSATFPATSTGGTAPTIGIAHGGGACTTTTGTGALVFNTAPTLSSPVLQTPVLGTPQSGNLVNCSGYTYSNLSGTIPTWNQSTTGNAATATAPASGGSFITSSNIGSQSVSSATTAGNVSGIVAIANGGTGSSTKNFVDLTTTQSVSGSKTFTSLTSGGTTPVTMGSATPAGTGINCQAYNFTAGTSIYRDVSGTFPIVIANGTGQFLHENNGNFVISGSIATKASGTTWANPSDVRLKDKVANYTGSLSQLMQVQPKTWEYNGKGGTTAGTKGIGVIADEIQNILPNTVGTYKAKLNPNDTAESDIKQFDATEITWLLVNAVKELKAEVDALKAAK